MEVATIILRTSCPKRVEQLHQIRGTTVKWTHPAASVPIGPVARGAWGTEARMLTVDDYGAIRRAFRDGMSIREIAPTFGPCRRKVREVLATPQPKPYPRTQLPPAPVLGPFHAVIDALLAQDEDAPPKQRHTAMQLFRRLRDEHGYQGGYDQVRRYVGRR